MELSNDNVPCMAVHGGAWKIPEQLKDDSELGVRDAAIVGYRTLEKGGSCVDAVVAAVSSLEDNPCFDAGRGSVLNENREIEMHAMVMRGDTCDVGACIGLKTTKNPVRAARVTLEQSHHCVMLNEAAINLGRKHGVEEKDFDYFLTDYAQEEFDSMPNYSSSLADLFSSTTRGHDTVGAVAFDKEGNLACATSTGGITRQISGRVSDSCLVGSGGFADNEIGAISTTGHGESIMKVNLARLIGFHMQQGLSPYKASQVALEHMKQRVGGCGGAITINWKGDVDFFFNTNNMSWAVIRGTSKQANGSVKVEYGIDMTNVKAEEVSMLDAQPSSLHSLRILYNSGAMVNLNGKRNRSPPLDIHRNRSDCSSNDSADSSPGTSSGADSDEEVRRLTSKKLRK